MEKFLLSECLESFANAEYSNSKGRVRSEMTKKTYRSLCAQVLSIVDDFNILEYDLKELNQVKNRVQYKRAKARWELLATQIKKSSKNLSELTLKTRLQFVYNALARIEEELTIETGKKAFKYKAQQGEVVVIDQKLYKETVQHAKIVASASGKYTKQQKYGALAFLLGAYTSARLRDLINLRYSQNIHFGNYTYPSFLTYKNKKTDTKPVTIKLTEDIINIIMGMKGKSDYILGGYTDVTIRNDFKDFLMTMPQYHNKVTKIVNIANGSTNTKLIPMYESITPHNVRATFITQMIEKGVDLETIMSFSGHSNITTLSKRYANVSEAHKQSQYDSYTAMFE